MVPKRFSRYSRFRTFRTFSGEGVAGLGLSPKFYQFFSASLTSDWETLAAEMKVAPPNKLLTLHMYTVAYMPILLFGKAPWYLWRYGFVGFCAKVGECVTGADNPLDCNYYKSTCDAKTMPRHNGPEGRVL